jgi:hypothetical protein
VEKFKASQAALEIKNEDHAGHRKVEIIGKKVGVFSISLNFVLLNETM